MSFQTRSFKFSEMQSKSARVVKAYSLQSKLLERFAVFLPSQCWCVRLGELTAINNIGRTRRWARTEKRKNKNKTALGGSAPTIFV